MSATQTKQTREEFTKEQLEHWSTQMLENIKQGRYQAAANCAKFVQQDLAELIAKA